MTHQCHHGQLARVCELCEKDGEVKRLRGENAVLLSLLVDCDAVLRTIEPESAAEAESLQALRGQINRALEPSRHKGPLL